MRLFLDGMNNDMVLSVCSYICLPTNCVHNNGKIPFRMTNTFFIQGYLKHQCRHTLKSASQLIKHVHNDPITCYHILSIHKITPWNVAQLQQLTY